MPTTRATSSRTTSRSDSRGSDNPGSSGVQHAAPNTDVSIILSGLLGLGLTAGFYALLGHAQSIPSLSTVVTLFTERGDVPRAIAFLSFWSVAILLLKGVKLFAQVRSLRTNLLPDSIGGKVSHQNAARYRAHIAKLGLDPSRSFLVHRVSRALEQLRAGSRSDEVSHMLSAQSEMDADAVESSYSTVKVLLWAVPILGFVGTVLGIGDAVGHFASAINLNSADPEQQLHAIKTSLSGVTGGLSQAFDTTLIGLVASILLVLPAHWLQKFEEALLVRIGSYCDQRLLVRLESRSQAAEIAQLLRSGVGEVLAEQQEAVRSWLGQLRAATAGMGDAAVRAWQQIQNDMRQQQEGIAQAWSTRLQELGTDLAERSFESWRRVEAEVQVGQRRQSEEARAILEEAAAERRAFRDDVRPLHEQCLRRLSRVAETLAETTVQVQQEFGAAQEAQARRLDEHGRTAADGLRDLARTVSESLREGIDQTRASQASLVERVGVLDATLDRHGEALRTTSDSLEGISRGLTESLPEKVEAHTKVCEESLARFEKLASLQRSIAQNLARLSSSTPLAQTLNGLHRAVGRLLVVTQDRKSTGWIPHGLWSLLSRKNGRA